MSNSRIISRILVTNLWTAYGKQFVLRGASAEFRSGKLNILQGANGSGKSTLLAAVGMLIAPTRGTVDYGCALDEEALRARMGWVSHESCAYGDLTCRENIELAARLCGVDPGSAWNRVSERFALVTFEHKSLRTLSRGQRQRVALAKSLVHEPDLLLLDEPTTGLDAGSVQSLVRAVGEELTKGVLVLLVTHDVSPFSDLDRAMFRLERGRVLMEA